MKGQSRDIFFTIIMMAISGFICFSLGLFASWKLGWGEQRILIQYEATEPSETTTTTEHSVNPYDNTGLRVESQDVSTDGGSSTSVESYSGQPDHVATSSSASSIVTQSGSDLLETDRKTIGRNGRRFLPSELIDSGIEALDRLDILDIIINDLAEEIFLQVWIY
jgi:hypothetical protein